LEKSNIFVGKLILLILFTCIQITLDLKVAIVFCF